jgi:hypothetical protein
MAVLVRLSHDTYVCSLCTLLGSYSLLNLNRNPWKLITAAEPLLNPYLPHSN